MGSSSSVDKLVSYPDDSPVISAKAAEVSLEDPHIPQNIQQENYSPPRGVESVIFGVKSESDPPFDFVGTAKSCSLDQFNSANWLFHEIKELKTKNLSLHSKLGEIEAKVAGLIQLEAEKNTTVKDNTQKDNTVENDIEKIKGTIHEKKC